MKNMYVLPLEQLQQISEKMRDAIDQETVNRLLKETLECYGIVNFEFNKIDNFWRGVECSSPDGHPNVMRVGYPPKNKTRNNRMNDAGEPLLYTCMNKFTVLEEIQAKAGDFIHLVVYGLKEGAHLKAAMVGQIAEAQRSGRSAISYEFSQEMIRIMNSMRPDVAKSFVFTDAFLASILSDKNAKNNDYMFSRTLARFLFLKMPEVDSVFYPSVVHEGALNLAIKPNAVDSKFVPKMNFVVRITRKYDYGIYDFDIMRQSNSLHDDGTIIWE